MSIAHIRSGLLSHFPQVIRDLGYDPEVIFQESDFDAELFKGEETSIPASQVGKLFQAAEKETRCRHLWLLMGASIGMTNLGPIILMMQSASTFGDAIAKNIKYVKVSMPNLRRELHQEGRTAYISNIFSNPEFSQSRGLAVSSVTILWRVCNITTNNKWHPKQICFTFDEPQDSQFYSRLFRIPVIFNADFDGIIFDSDDLNIELSSSDNALHEVLHDYLTLLDNDIPVDFLESIKALIRKQLVTGSCSIDKIVEYLPYEKRALQRKLVEKGSSYQELLDDVRFEKALTYLKDSNVTMSRLADILCYTNVSVFSKAFKKRFGVSPKIWQKQYNEKYR